MPDVQLLRRFVERLAAQDAWHDLPPLVDRIEQLRGTALEPEEAEFCAYYRGLAFLETERADEALPTLRRLVSGSPANPHYRLLLADALIRGQHWPEARSQLEAALSAAPGHPGCLCALGWTLYQMGHRTRAKALLERALDLHPHYHPAHLDLGLILAAEGRWDESEMHLQTAMSLAPDDPDVQEALKAVQESRSREGSDREQIRALFPEIRQGRSRLDAEERQVLRKLRRWLREKGSSHLEILLVEGVWTEVADTVAPTPRLDNAWAAALAWTCHRMLGHPVRRTEVAEHWGVSTGALGRRYRRIRDLMDGGYPAAGEEPEIPADPAPADPPAAPSGLLIPVDFKTRRRLPDSAPCPCGSGLPVGTCPHPRSTRLGS